MAFRDSGEADGLLYLVRDLVDGVDLRRLLQSNGRLQTTVACWIARDVARVAGYVHSRGYVRLDLKPSNVLLATTGRVVLADLGIVVHEHTLASADRAQGFVGTPMYAAPEQLGSGMVDARTDIYSLGAVIYEMLAGRPPMSDAGPEQLLDAGVRPEPPPLREIVQVPQAVDDLVMRCLRTDPDLRFQTMREVADQLELLVSSGDGEIISTLVPAA